MNIPNPNTELVLAGSKAVERTPPLAIESFESVLRYAIEKGVPTESIMSMRRELKAEADKAEFDRALAAFQSECPVIRKTKAVSDNTGRQLYAYAPFEYIVAQVAPLLQRHGFSFQLDTDTASQDGWVIAMCHVTHAAGHCRTSTAKFPIGAGTRAMSTTQVFAAALSFASRRVFCNSFGIVCAGEDDDAAAGTKPKPVGPSTLAADTAVKDLARELWNILKPVRGPQHNWNTANQWLVDEMITSDTEFCPDLTASRYLEVIAKAKKKLG